MIWICYIRLGTCQNFQTLTSGLPSWMCQKFPWAIFRGVLRNLYIHGIVVDWIQSFFCNIVMFSHSNCWWWSSLIFEGGSNPIVTYTTLLYHHERFIAFITKWTIQPENDTFRLNTLISNWCHLKNGGHLGYVKMGPPPKLLRISYSIIVQSLLRCFCYKLNKTAK